MATKYRMTGLRIAILVGVCISLGGYLENVAYQSRPQRPPLSRAMRPEADASPSTTVHLDGPGARLVSVESFLPSPVADGQILPVACQILPTVVSSGVWRNRAPPSA
jgi:hypothetical protein